MDSTISEEPGNNNETIPFSKPITARFIGRNATYKDGKAAWKIYLERMTVLMASPL